MKYKQAMATQDQASWTKAVQEEHERMVHHGVFKVTSRTHLPHGIKVLTSTWAMKKKSNGTYRARLNARGYEQVDGKRYDEDSKAAPVANTATIFVVMTLIVILDWEAILMDVNGAFLHGEFEKGSRVHLKVPEGFEKCYPGNVVLELKKTLYGTKQAAKAFWLILLNAMAAMGFSRSKVDPCLYHISKLI
jgi:Reverse transcriptase (RNA-dependent DNA polymerase)